MAKMPESRLTRLAEEMVRKPYRRVLHYWSPAQPVSIRERADDLVGRAGGWMGVLLLLAVVATLTVGWVTRSDLLHWLFVALLLLFIEYWRRNRTSTW